MATRLARTVAVTASIDEAKWRWQTFDLVDNTSIRPVDEANDQRIFRCDLNQDAALTISAHLNSFECLPEGGCSRRESGFLSDLRAITQRFGVQSIYQDQK